MASPHQQTRRPGTGTAAAIRRVVPLADAADDEMPGMGAKAAGLARMLRAGLPVPPGFCVTGRAYRVHVSSGAVGRKLREATARLKTAPAEAVPTVLAEIRRAIRDAALAAEVRRGIERQWLEIAAPAFAVRSSATAEDLPAMSFAGQYDTHLAVTGLATCLQRVKDCWASLWSRRAYEYRGRAGIDHRSVAMAVIVQAMVPAEAAGVAFTADPVSGRRDQVIVEGSYGLGKAVVDGLVTPDRVVVSRRVTVVERRTTAGKARQLVPAPGGGVRELPVDADRAGRPCIDDVTAVRLAKLAVRAEALFGAPQDVEWALAGGQIHLLQSRPITALPPKPDRPWEDRQIWTNSNLREAAPDPVTPMTWSFIYHFWEPMFAPLLRAVGIEEDPARFAGLVGGRVYFNVNAGVAIARRLGRLAQDDTRALFGDGHLTGAEAEVCLPDEDLPDIRLPWWRKLVRWPVLPLRFLWDASRVRPQLLPGSRALLRELEGRPWRAHPDARLVERLGELLGAIRRTLSDVFPVLIAGMGFYLVLVRLCGRWFGEEGLSIAHRLLAGTGGMEDAEAGVALWQLAAMAHRDAGVEKAVRGENGFAAVRQRLGGTPGGQAFLGAWSRFMATHGHHARGVLDRKSVV